VKSAGHRRPPLCLTPLAPLTCGGLVLMSALLLSAFYAWADADPLFEGLAPLTVEISAPFRTMTRDRSDEPEYSEGVLSLVDADGAASSKFDIKVRPRGGARRDPRVCRFPPLRVNFRKDEVAGTLFAGQDKLKLVTHCRRGERYQQYLIKEYLVYRMLNVLTDVSFRVRPLTVRYLDSERASSSEEAHFAFFIEDEGRLAHRVGLEVADVVEVPRDRLAPLHTSLMDHFQFMIGNTDYAFIAGPAGENCCHNAILLQDADGRYLPIPYDFDMTGFVDSPHALVDERLPISDVKTRLYRGICRGSAPRDAAVARFREVRQAILDVVRQADGLGDRERREALQYLEGFYEVLDDPPAYEQAVVLRCRP
jgi:hypothetical protein